MPDVVTVASPVVNVSTSSTAITVTPAATSSTSVTAPVTEYTITVDEAPIVVLATSYVAVDTGGGSGSGNSYFPSGW